MQLGIDSHFFVLVAENVIVEHIIIASLFFEEVAILVHMLVIRVHSHEIATSLILEYRLLNHGVICAFSLSGGAYRERTLLLALIVSTDFCNVVHFLLHHFRQKRPFDNTTLFKALIT